MSNSD